MIIINTPVHPNHDANISRIERTFCRIVVIYSFLDLSSLFSAFFIIPILALNTSSFCNQVGKKPRKKSVTLCQKYGVTLESLPTLRKQLLTNVLVDGTKSDAFLIFDMLVLTKYVLICSI